MKNILHLLILTPLFLCACEKNALSVLAPVQEIASSSPHTPFLFPAFTEDETGKHWGFINDTGNFVIPPRYSGVSDFNAEGYALIYERPHTEEETSATLFSVIHQSGKIISGPFKSPYGEPENLETPLIIEKDAQSGILDQKGKVLFLCMQKIWNVADGMVGFYEGSLKNPIFGYMDMKGSIVIPAQFKSAGSFIHGTAVVTHADKSYSLIDKQGKVIKNSVAFIPEPSKDELYPAFEPSKNAFGYKNLAENFVIDPIFSYAESFTDNYAIVGQEVPGQELPGQEATLRYGIIDKNGNMLIQPCYGGLVNLGKGFFLATEEDAPPGSLPFVPKFLLNHTGESLSEPIYYGYQNFQYGFASLSDKQHTRLLNDKGQIQANFPALSGNGDITFQHGLFKTNINNRLAYYRSNGSLVWMAKDTLPLGGSILKKLQLHPTPGTFIEYPQIESLADPIVKEQINKTLQQRFSDTSYPIGDLKSSANFQNGSILHWITVQFKATVNQYLLSIHKDVLVYSVGAAHGKSFREIYHIDLRSGKFYSLDDLFKTGIHAEAQLLAYIQKEADRRRSLAEDNHHGLEKPTQLSTAKLFTLEKNHLRITYSPDEIASSGTLYVDFSIPYKDLLPLIHETGDFWNSFHKDLPE